VDRGNKNHARLCRANEKPSGKEITETSATENTGARH
jgi:hypothetical protein